MTVEQLLAGVVIPIDKPRQWTSFQAVNKVKSAIRNHYGLKKFKIGHAGTLDPLATGLLKKHLVLSLAKYVSRQLDVCLKQ